MSKVNLYALISGLMLAFLFRQEQVTSVYWETFVSVLVHLHCWKVATELKSREIFAGTAFASTAPSWPHCGERLAGMSCTWSSLSSGACTAASTLAQSCLQISLRQVSLRVPGCTTKHEHGCPISFPEETTVWFHIFSQRTAGLLGQKALWL